jgi:hypothetical protein
MRRRQTSLPGWGSWFAALVLVAQVGFPGATAPVSGSLSGSGPSLSNLRSAQAEDTTSNGIAVVGPEAIQVRPADEDQAAAFNTALELAYAHRDDLGYPWLDAASGVLELSFATGLGETVAAAAVDRLSAGGRTVRLRPAPASVAELDALADAVTRLNADGVPGADRIWKTEADQKNNRIIITVSEAPDELLDALAARFGTERIAVRIQGPPPGASTAANRDSDSPPFWGGAKFYPDLTCTTGFPWNVGSGVSGMLTAGHCAPTGSNSVNYPNYNNVGFIRSASEENWDATYGTQYFSGQSVYRGDLALVRYRSSYSSGPYVYSGGPHTSTASAVDSMASRRSQWGDAACVNGVVTGEWCGMVVGTGLNILYLVAGPNVWARNVVEARALGNTCPTRGDSGAPVYRKLSATRVAAVGIFSGWFAQVVACTVWFTDIWDAYYGLPGSLKVAP